MEFIFRNYIAPTKIKEDSPFKWYSVDCKLPPEGETVWITNGKGWTSLGCYVYDNDNWCWAEGNGVVFEENGKIVSECELDDLDVKYWFPLPPPKKESDDTAQYYIPDYL